MNSVGWLLEDELEVNYGDVNFDNKVNILDIVKIVNHIIGRSNFTDPRQLKAADVDFKEGITSNDVVIIVDYILGRIKVLPYKPQSSVINNQYSPNLVANDVNVKYSDNNLVADISVKNIGNGIFYEEINNTITLTKNNNENITISRKEKLKLNPKEILYIGDSIFDYIAAKKAGFKFMAVTTGYYTSKDFQKKGLKKHYILSSLRGVERCLNAYFVE